MNNYICRNKEKNSMKKAKKKTNNSVIIHSEMQIQSYIATTAHYDFDIYQQRVLCNLCDLAQERLKGASLSGQVDPNLFSVSVTMPIRSILYDEDDKNYEKAKKSLKGLAQKGFEFENEETWKYISIIIAPTIEKRKGNVTFEVHKDLWRAISNFSKGYRLYEYRLSMSFKSVNAIRFYQLFSRQSKPITYTIDALRDMFKLKDRYKTVARFVEQVVDMSKEELDEKSPYTFKYKKIYTRHKEGAGRPTLTALEFTPIYQEDKDTHKNERPTLATCGLDCRLIEMLQDNFFFDEAGILNNLDTLMMMQEYRLNNGIQFFLMDMVLRGLHEICHGGVISRPAYLIACLNKENGIKILHALAVKTLWGEGTFTEMMQAWKAQGINTKSLITQIKALAKS